MVKAPPLIGKNAGKKPRNSMWPQLGFIIEMPDPLIQSDRFARMHNRISKECVQETLEWWKAKVLREHFKQTNRHRYGHKPRGKGWKALKRRVFKSVTDLKASGETERKMKNERPHISVGGKASTVLNGTLSLSFPFPPSGNRAGRGAFSKIEFNERAKVTTKDMANELTAWSPEDLQQAVAFYMRRYDEKLDKVLKRSPKWRRIIASKSSGQPS